MTPHAIYIVSARDGSFISGVFISDDEAHAYAKEHDHQVACMHTTFPLYKIESRHFRKQGIEGWASTETLSDYFESWAERKPPQAEVDDDFAIVTLFTGPWTPPEEHQGKDYMGSLPHHHVTWYDLARFVAGETPLIVLGMERSGIEEASGWWHNEVIQPELDRADPDPEEEFTEPLTRDDLRRFIAALTLKYMKSEESGPTQGLLAVLAEIQNLRGMSDPGGDADPKTA